MLILWGAQQFSNHMTELFNVVSGTGIFRSEPDMKSEERSEFDIEELLGNTKDSMEKIMHQKERAVEKIKAFAEKEMEKYGPYIDDIDFEDAFDFNAKKVVIESDINPLSSQSQKEIRETINYLPTEPVWDDFKEKKTRPMLNLNHSSIHVPTNIYDKSMKILNGIKWTKSMTKQYVANRRRDPQLTWQYFCSSDGFFRIYPGMQWPRHADKVDTFDCRVRQWYIQAATSPKNIIILLDTSGSMKGLRLSIAKSTVFTILDTLSDEDYFNVIQFSDETKYVVDCFNGTLMPATVDNIRRMKGMIEELEAKKYANFENALNTAFHLFKKELRFNHMNKICNRAIMLITDGPPDNYDSIFKLNNWPKKPVRVFTFLIGKEVQDNRQARWMACANKGKFTHISTRADVQENVQKYVKVLSRPLAIKKASHKVWTPVYLDYVTLQDEILVKPGRETQLEVDYENIFNFKGLGLVMSVSMPVFDRRASDRVGPNEEDPKRNLLGVAGADLRINELMKLLPTFQLGANGYAFAITNHGYVLFHPDYKPFFTEQADNMFRLVPRLKYNSVELSGVERPSDSVSHEHPLSHYLLRTGKGEMELSVVTHIDKNLKYVETRTNFYKFVEISNAFRLVFTIPKNYGFGRIKLEQPYEQTWDEYNVTDEELPYSIYLSYSPWIYCKALNVREGYQAVKPVAFHYFADPNLLREKCGETLAQHMLKDITIVKKYFRAWAGSRRLHSPKYKYIKEYDKCSSKKSTITKMACTQKVHYRSFGIELLWVGTRSGITQHLITIQKPEVKVSEIESKYTREHTQTVKSVYYQRAVSLWEKGYKYVFTGPVSTIQKEFEFNNSLVTIAHVEIVGLKPQVPAAVVAFQMKYNNFYNTFVKYTFHCHVCSYTCKDTEHFDCFIIDNNGYVLATNNPDMNGTSLFLGETQGVLMRAMVDESIFEEIQLTDFQSTCLSKILSGQDNASNFMYNPLQLLSKFLVWFATELIIFMSQLTVMTWNGITGVLGFDETLSENGECGQWIPEAYARYLFCGFVIKRATGEKKAASFITQRRPCEQRVTRFNINLDALKKRKIRSSIQSCATQCRENKPSYQIKRLNQSNLFFVVADSNCRCDKPPAFTANYYYGDDEEDEESEKDDLEKYKFSMKPKERTYLENDQCQRLRNLSEELKQVDKTRFSHTLCLDSSSENDTLCTNASHHPLLRPPLGLYTGMVLSVLLISQILLGINNTGLR